MLNIKFHEGLTVEKWRSLPQEKRILNLAAELARAIKALEAKDTVSVDRALERALELADLTVEAWQKDQSFSWLREFLRFRELLAEFYIHPAKDRESLALLARGLLDLDPGAHNLRLEF